MSNWGILLISMRTRYIKMFIIHVCQPVQIERVVCSSGSGHCTVNQGSIPVLA